MHRTYHITGELLAERVTASGREADSILVDLVVCGATQETSALWYARHAATYEAGYTYAGWVTVDIQEVTNHDTVVSQ